MLEKKNDNDVEAEISAIIDRLERLASYKESKKDSHLVLQHDNVLLVEICDTSKDRELYYMVINDYLCYVKEYYATETKVELIDIEKCFNDELLIDRDKKLPMFFAYRDSKLLGTVGYRSYFEILDENNKKHIYNEYSIRFATAKKTGNSIGKSGFVAFFMAYLYGLKNNSNLVSLSYKQNRDLLFHLSMTTGQVFLEEVRLKTPVTTLYDNYDIFTHSSVSPVIKQGIIEHYKGIYK